VASSEKPFWFRMDPAAFLQDKVVVLMTTLELGAYFRLLCRQWIDGYIPDDTRDLGRLCQLDANAMGEVWVTLSKVFPVIEPGKRANRFMRSERDAVIADMQSRSTQGRRDARKRWDKDRSPNGSPIGSPNESGNGSPIGDRMQEYSKEQYSKEQHSEEPGLDGSPISTPPNHKRADLVDEIGHLYPGNKRPKGRELPRIQYDAILDALLADGDKVLNGTKAFAAAVAKWPAHRRQFIPSADKWYREAKYLTNPTEWAEVKPGAPVNRFPIQSGLNAHERMMRDLLEAD
jgi:uncharacterized protein YdaU (DUF1376 family)